MKKFLILFLICLGQNVFSQTTKGNSYENTNNSETLPYIPVHEVINEQNEVYNLAGIEVRPEFPGGQEAFSKYIKDNYKNPQKDLKGKVYVTFIVENDGSLNNIKILKDIGYGTGQEVIRVLKKSPKWTPGKQNNKIVRVQYSLPVIIN